MPTDKEKNYAVLNARLKKQYKKLVREIAEQKDALFNQDLKRLQVADKWLKFSKDHHAETQKQLLGHPFLPVYVPPCSPAPFTPI